MSSPPPRLHVSRLKLFVAAGFALIVMVYLLYISSDLSSPPERLDDEGDPERASSALATLPIAWDDHVPGRPVRISLKGGSLHLEDELGGDIELALSIQGAEPISWTARHKERGELRVIGSTRFQGAPITITWHFYAGDPQVTLTVEVPKIPLRSLSEPIVAELNLQKEVAFEAFGVGLVSRPISRPMTLNSWTPGWLRARRALGEETLTFSEWTFSALRVDPAEGRLGWVIWAPQAEADLEPCASPDATLSLRQSVTMSLGERAQIVPSRYALGYRAALAPLFIDPASHYASMYKEGGARSAQDFAERARTLLYGHSDRTDPRFGNGGLLGLGLGADLGIRPEWERATEIEELIEEFDGARVSALTSGAPHRLLESASCELALTPQRPYLTLGDARSIDALNLPSHPPAEQVGGERLELGFPNMSLDLTPHMEVPQLSGRRTALVDSLLSTEALEALIEARGLLAFAAPLIATRNPLTTAASQALLVPERGGHWTLSEPLARALTNVELINERHELVVLSPTALLEHWRRARQVRLFELPDGSLAALNPHPEPIAGFTLIASGSLSPTWGEARRAPLGSDTAPAQDGTVQTWFWFDLPSGLTRFDLDREPRSPRLTPITWTLAEPKG